MGVQWWSVGRSFACATRTFCAFSASYVGRASAASATSLRIAAMDSVQPVTARSAATGSMLCPALVSCLSMAVSSSAAVSTRQLRAAVAQACRAKRKQARTLGRKVVLSPELLSSFTARDRSRQPGGDSSIALLTACVQLRKHVLALGGLCGGETPACSLHAAAPTTLRAERSPFRHR